MIAANKRLRFRIEGKTSISSLQMQTADNVPNHLPLGETLKQLLETDDERGLSIREITGAVGEKGFGLVLIILSLPSALPVPAPGYSIPFGIAMAIIAAQMIIGRKKIWLPQRISNYRINQKLIKKAVNSNFLARVEKLIKPRLRFLHSKFGHSLLSIIILIMAIFMMIPIPGTNTLPAMAIFAIGISMVEEDGLVAIGALLCSITAICVSGAIVYLFITVGPEAAESVKESIKSLFGLGS